MFKLSNTATTSVFMEKLGVDPVEVKTILRKKLQESPEYQQHIQSTFAAAEHLVNNSKKLSARLAQQGQDVIHGYFEYLLYTLFSAPVSPKLLKKFIKVYIKANKGMPIRMSEKYYLIK